MAKLRKKAEENEKILDVDASMQGTITFKDPVNLRINGDFEGTLETKGKLTIGENATVKADIRGDIIKVSGKVYGDIFATESINLINPAKIEGNITAPVLSITEGAVINGRIQMTNIGQIESPDIFTLNEVAAYLEIETSLLEEWAKSNKIPAYFENNRYMFKKSEIDKWVQEEKVKI